MKTVDEIIGDHGEMVFYMHESRLSIERRKIVHCLIILKKLKMKKFF